MTSSSGSSRPSPPPSPLVGGLPAEGDRLGGRYVVGARLGRGAMGAVYEAVHETLGTRHAIKVLAPTGPVDEAARRRFEREARIAATLRSPHLVAVTDVERDATGLTWFVMERLEGEDLGQRLGRAPPLEVAASVRIARDVARALEPVHAAGVVHRDLKPSNVFLESRPAGEPPHVRVLDFGVAALRDEHAERTSTGAVVGTPRTMAPEQLLGERADARADVWAVGVVLYRMLAGRWPYEGATPAAIMLAVVGGRAPLAELRPDLPPALVALVDGALEQALPERLASARELGDGLDAVLAALARTAAPAGDASPLNAGVPSPSPSPARAAKARAPGWRGAAGLVAAALVAGGLAVLLGGSSLRQDAGTPAASRGDHPTDPSSAAPPGEVARPHAPGEPGEPAEPVALPAPPPRSSEPPAAAPPPAPRPSRSAAQAAAAPASLPVAPPVAAPNPPLTASPAPAPPPSAPPAAAPSARGDGFPAHL